MWQSDLAIERRCADITLPGVCFSEEQTGEVRLSKLVITSKEGAESLGRPQGEYDTLSFPLPTHMDEKIKKELFLRFSSLLSEMLPLSAHRILIVGLGNRRLSADCIGPAIVDRITATAHIEKEEKPLFEQLGCRALSLFCPGVLAQTGIEAVSLAAAAVKQTEADAVLTFDALCAREYPRLLRTVQIGNTGISPGSGIGNRRPRMDAASMGVPVIAVGVPTVIPTAAFIDDVPQTPKASDAVRPNRLPPDCYVCPHDLDEGISILSPLLAQAVNHTFGIASLTVL